MKIVGTHIQTLAVARYFAARMAELLVFDSSFCDPDRIPHMKEIMSWIDGVEWAIEVGESSSPIDFISKETGIESIVTPTVLDRPHLEQIVKYPTSTDVNSSRWIVARSGIPPRRRPGLEIYCEIDTLHLDPQFYRDIDGVVVRAPEESQVGLANFDEADQILDWLEHQNMLP